MKNADELVNYLFNKRANDLPPRALAEVFDRLIWCLDDNGAELLSILKTWWLSDDIDKVKIVLQMSEVFPFCSVDEMRVSLKQVKEKWPSLSNEVQDYWNHWDDLVKKNWHK